VLEDVAGGAGEVGLVYDVEVLGVGAVDVAVNPAIGGELKTVKTGEFTRSSFEAVCHRHHLLRGCDVGCFQIILIDGAQARYIHKPGTGRKSHASVSFGIRGRKITAMWLDEQAGTVEAIVLNNRMWIGGIPIYIVTGIPLTGRGKG